MAEIRALKVSSGADRRCAHRRKLETRVALKTDKAIFFMESVDISSSGIRVQSEIGIEVGTHCRLVPFFDDVSRLFEASGTVVRMRETNRSNSEMGTAQMGIQFDALSPSELEALLMILSNEPVHLPQPSLVAGGRA
jgi:c-di-GMP-binding flagellar brake protein YcgR